MQATFGVPVAGAAVAGQPAPTAYPAERLNVMPDEFMRGGGCFAPSALVGKVDATARTGTGTGTAAPLPTRMEAVRAGDLLRTADGGVARVRCVVATECEGGRAELVVLPGPASGWGWGSCELTSWHPVREAASGEWRFPCTLGTPRVRACAHVFNLVLDRSHVLLVGGEARTPTRGHSQRGRSQRNPSSQ